MPIILGILCFLFSLSTWAQPKAYFDVEDSFFSSPRLVVDGKELTLGFWGFKNLPEALSSDAKARELAESYRIYRNWGHGLLWGGLGAAIIYAAATSSSDSANDNFKLETYWTLFAIGFIPGIFLQARANTKLIRAINQYNGVYSTETTGWKITPATKGLGIAIHF